MNKAGYSIERKMWLTWHYQVRTRNIADSLNVPVYEYFNNRNLLSRHFLSSLWTIKILLTKRPQKIIIQCSFLLLLIVAIYKVFNSNKVTLIVDCHTKALRRKAPGIFNYLFWPLKKISFRSANLTIISNEGLLCDLKRLHHNFIILPDKIPEKKIMSKRSFPSKYCVYISSFSVDEPFDEILKLSEIVKDDIKIFWTGAYPQKVDKIKEKYLNIQFTGYLSFEDFYNLIGNADCILALTTEEDCLQSGAYEALSFEVPLVVSDTQALRNYFQDTAIYTSHSPANIAQSITRALNNSHELKNKMKELKKLRSEEFGLKLREVEFLLSDNIKK